MLDPTARGLSSVTLGLSRTGLMSDLSRLGLMLGLSGWDLVAEGFGSAMLGPSGLGLVAEGLGSVV